MMKYLLFVFFAFLGSLSFGQDLYDLETVQTIEVTFAESNWDALMDAQKNGAGDYILAQSVAINGIVFDSVGVKYKGNSSYSANQVKNPWHIELDTYKDHEYDGYTDIKLANGKNDPSFLRDVLNFQIIRQYMDAPLANYANLYVNGELIGLYTNTESISKKFAKSRFGSKDNAYFDCSPPDGAGPQSRDLPKLIYLGEDSTNYYDAYDMKSDYGWNELIDLCDTLSNSINDIKKILDVDRALWMLAFDNVTVNLDSYIGSFAQNYYLYRGDYGQFFPIIWDMNESYGVFTMTGTSNLNSNTDKQQMDHLLHINNADYPLVSKLLSIPMYKRMYLAHYKTILLENFDNNAYYNSSLKYQATIDASVQADPNKFYTYNNFVDNLDSDIGGGGGPGGGRTIPGIATLMNNRSSYLLGLSDFTQTEPSIADAVLSDANPTVGDAVNLTASVTDGDKVFLGYRTGTIAPFTRVEMFDDGAHNDGAAGDGVFGVGLDITNVMTQYYIYAENDNAGMFSPRRAEYEYHVITATNATAAAGDLVINEFMASNSVTAADQDGEFDDWIELYNNGATTIDLEGYFLSDDEVNLMQWAFPSGTTIGAGEYLIVWADDDIDQDGLHANFKLSAGGESVILSDAVGAIVDQVTYVDQVEDISHGRFPNGTGDFIDMAPTFNSENVLISGTVEVVINEFMASNDMTVADQDGEFDDWIELYNNGTESVDLSGYFLTDDDTDLMQWTFPAGTVIEAGGYLIIWADNDEDQAGLHANFGLSGSGESVVLTDATGTIIDQVTYGEQTTDIAHGRFPNGTGDFISIAPTFNAENVINIETGDVVINEFMASNEATVADQDGEFDDWIELYNNGTTSIDLEGYFLSDDDTDLMQWVFPADVTIGAGEYLIIWADDNGDQDGLHANFKLSAGGESIFLSDATGAVIDQVTYVDQVADISHGRFPNGTGDFQDMDPTFNAENKIMVSTDNLSVDAQSVNVYPNPAGNSFYISMTDYNLVDNQVLVFDINGKIVYEDIVRSEHLVDCTSWTTGMYIIKVGDVYKKVVVD
jgi:hypothetical protein